VTGLLLGAAACAGGATWLWCSPSGPAVRLRLAAADTGPRTPVRSLPPAPVLGALAAASVVAGGPVAGAAAAALGLTVVHRRRTARLEAQADAERAAGVALCEALASELRSGRPPGAALTSAAAATPGAAARALSRAAGVAVLGGDVAAALRPEANSRSAGPVERLLAALAACWEVGARSGAGLAATVDRLAEGLRADERRRQEIAGELAGPRATARLLAVLPLVGLLLAAALGADPLHFLLRTPLGAACLALAFALDLAGLAWTDRLVRRARDGA
jgi:tight adherence protein B